MARIPTPLFLHVLLLGALAVLIPAPARAVALPTAEREIAALLDMLGRSECRFQRNGNWHGAAQARAHLERKYAWLRRRDLAGTAEQFIQRAATRSSMTGRAYRVQCPGHPEVAADAWFRALLARLRVPPATR